MDIQLIRESDRADMLELLEEWPNEGGDFDRSITAWIEQNKHYTETITDDTGFVFTQICRDSRGLAIGWRRMQVTDRHLFCLNDAVRPEAQGEGHYQTMIDVVTILAFETMKLDGVIWEVPVWTVDKARADAEKRGYSILHELPEGKIILGANREWYESRS